MGPNPYLHGSADRAVLLVAHRHGVQMVLNPYLHGSADRAIPLVAPPAWSADGV